MSPRRRGPRPISSAIGQIVDARAPKTLLAEVQRAWPAACGEAMARETDPVSEKQGVITVRCRSAVWASELEMMHDEVLERLGKELGERRPERLRFVVGEG